MGFFPDAEEYEPFNEGNYNAVVEEATVNLDKDDNGKDRSRINFQFRVLEGHFENRKLWSNFDVTDPIGKGRTYCADGLRKLDINLDAMEKVEDVADTLAGLVGKKVEVYVKPSQYNGKTYNNTYFNGWVKDAGDQGEEVGGFEPDSKIPF